MKILTWIQNKKTEYKQSKIKFLIKSILLFLIFLFFFSVPALSGTTLSIIPIILMGVIGGGTLIWMILYEKIYVDRIILATILFLLSTLVSGLVNGFYGINKTYFLMPIMFIAFYHLFSSKTFFNNSIRLFSLAIFAFCLYFLIVYFQDIISGNFSRLGDKFDDENVVGSYFAIGTILFTFFVFFKKKKFFIIPLVLCLLFCVLTGSKAALLLSGVGIVFLVFAFYGKKRWYIPAIFFLLIIIFVVLALQLPGMEYIKYRILVLFQFLSGDVNADPSTLYRLSLIIDGFDLFIKKPIFGWGFNGVELNSSIGAYAHNTLIESLANFGLLAGIFVMYPSFSSLSVFKFDKKEKEYAVLIQAFIIFSILNGFFLVQYISKLYYIMLAMICGYCKINNQNQDLLSISLIEGGGNI